MLYQVKKRNPGLISSFITLKTCRVMINAKTRPMVRAKQTRTGEGYTKSFNCTYKDYC